MWGGRGEDVQVSVSQVSHFPSPGTLIARHPPSQRNARGRTRTHAKARTRTQKRACARQSMHAKKARTRTQRHARARTEAQHPLVFCDGFRESQGPRPGARWPMRRLRPPPPPRGGRTPAPRSALATGAVQEGHTAQPGPVARGPGVLDGAEGASPLCWARTREAGDPEPPGAAMREGERRASMRAAADPDPPRLGRTARPDPSRTASPPLTARPRGAPSTTARPLGKSRGPPGPKSSLPEPSRTDVRCLAGGRGSAGLILGSSSPPRRSRWSLSWRQSKVTHEQMVSASDAGFSGSSVLCGFGGRVRTTCPSRPSGAPSLPASLSGRRCAQVSPGEGSGSHGASCGAPCPTCVPSSMVATTVNI